MSYKSISFDVSYDVDAPFLIAVTWQDSDAECHRFLTINKSDPNDFALSDYHDDRAYLRTDHMIYRTCNLSQLVRTAIKAAEEGAFKGQGTVKIIHQQLTVV